MDSYHDSCAHIHSIIQFHALYLHLFGLQKNWYRVLPAGATGYPEITSLLTITTTITTTCNKSETNNQISPRLSIQPRAYNLILKFPLG